MSLSSKLATLQRKLPWMTESQQIQQQKLVIKWPRDFVLCLWFSLAENLSAPYMGYLGATLTQVFTRVRRADVSFRDVTIAQMGNRVASANDITHRKFAEDLGIFWKSQVVELGTGHRTERLTFACSRGPWAGVARDGGGGQMKKPE